MPSFKPWPNGLRIGSSYLNSWDFFKPISESCAKERYSLTNDDLHSIGHERWINLDEQQQNQWGPTVHRYFDEVEIQIIANERPKKLTETRTNASDVVHDALKTNCRTLKEISTRFLMESWGKSKPPMANPTPRASNTGLPRDVWLKIFGMLCDVRSSGETVRHSLQNVSRAFMVCREFSSFRETILNEASKQCPSLQGSQSLWNRFAIDPRSLSSDNLTSLHEAACLGQETSDPIKVLNLLGFLGICAPCHVPARLLARRANH